MVPYKICSFDIEASSSHGDFPESIKNYKKVAYDIVYRLERVTKDDYSLVLKELLLNVFNLKRSTDIDICFPKETVTENMVLDSLKNMLKAKVEKKAELEDKIQKYLNPNQLKN
jgi:hypothetical protein